MFGCICSNKMLNLFKLALNLYKIFSYVNWINFSCVSYMPFNLKFLQEINLFININKLKFALKSMNIKFMKITNISTSQESSYQVTKCEREIWFIGNFWYGFISLYAQIHPNDRAQFTVECFAGIFVDNDYFVDGCYSAECKLKAGGCRRGCGATK